MNFPYKATLTLAFACSLILTGCDTPSDGMKAKKPPVSLHRSDEVGTIQMEEADAAEKISRLEEEVAALKKEMMAARPKIAKIDVMEQKFKDLSLGLDRIDATYNTKPVAPVAAHQISPQVPVAIPAPQPAPQPVTKPVTKPEMIAPAPPPPAPKIEKAPEPKPVPAQPTVKAEKIVRDLRIGEQKGSSRLVLDLGEVTTVNYDIDNEEKILLIDIPGFKWNGPKSKNFEKSPLIASYQADSDEKGARLVVQLKAPAKVANYSTIKATGGKSPRAVFDISPQ